MGLSRTFTFLFVPDNTLVLPKGMSAPLWSSRFVACVAQNTLVLDVEIVGETGQIKLKVFPEYEEQVRQTIQSSLADLGGNRIEVTTSAPLQTAQPKA
eukprot:m.311089 g.311089  ORF g.311089 m.311089 type:complete len:98 (+) comp15952_c0_seq19:455-748(+)